MAIMNINNNDNELTPDEEIILQQLLYKKQISLQKQLDEIRINQAVKNQFLEDKATQAENKAEQAINIITARAEKEDYIKSKVGKTHVTLGILGTYHNPVIGSQYMGRLLKRVGLAKENSRHTVPKSSYTSGKDPLCILDTGTSNFTTWHWHIDRTWKLIQERLIKMECYYDFNNKKNKDAVHEFINNLDFYEG